MPEFLERRFSMGCRRYFAVLSLFLYILTKVGRQDEAPVTTTQISVALYAGGVVLQPLLGWDLPTSAIGLGASTWCTARVMRQWWRLGCTQSRVA